MNKAEWDFAILNIVRVVDGDTVWCTVDLGFRASSVQEFRLARINAPEMSTPDGPVARSVAADWLSRKDGYLRVGVSKHPDNWGRWIGEIYDLKGENLSDYMLSTGNAKPWPAP